jgi:mannosyl-3-phosphoglycerate phosphatase
MPKTIIFTDLDGTLLDPKTYSFHKAMPALEEIRKRDIPLILCSSKTRAEIEVYRQRLRNRDPFVVENGGAVFVPAGYFPFPAGSSTLGEYGVSVFGRPYQDVRQEFIRLREKMHIAVRGFGDMTAGEIASLAGLSPEEAALAREREFGEPFVFERGIDVRFVRAAERDGFHWTQGRFFYLMGDHDKGKAIGLLKQWYGAEHGTLITIGLGDGLNDLPLLREVDLPVLVRKENGTYEERIDLPNIIRTDGIGPEGWNRAILRLLAR